MSMDWMMYFILISDGVTIQTFKIMDTVSLHCEPDWVACVSYAAGSTAYNVQFSIEFAMKLAKEIAGIMCLFM